jgi:hypothetical protein
MNESSSKFVDKLSMEKLINEKLMKVRHSPDNSYFINEDISFDGMEELILEKSGIKTVENVDGVTRFLIPSFYQQQYYPENNDIEIYYHPSVKPECNILLLHGLFDDNMSNFLFLIKQLNDLNFNVYLMVLPYHFNRKPAESLFGGEFFFSADLYRTRNAFKQAVLDIEAAFQFIETQNNLPRRLLGFSMGGCVAFRYYLLKQHKIRTFLLNPVTDLKRLPWDNQLVLTVGRDLNESGLHIDEINKILYEMDPCRNINCHFGFDNLSMACSLYDQIIEKSKYDVFIKTTGIENVIEYMAGHLNVLRVPRLSRDIYTFLIKD